MPFFIYIFLSFLFFKGDESFAVDRFIAVADALGGVTRYAYDQRGLQIAQTDALGRVTTYEYDVMGRRVARVLPQGQHEEMSYNTRGL